jgi:hypothetical protein
VSKPVDEYYGVQTNSNDNVLKSAQSSLR